ncbi:hypothetical protein FS749_013880 [Ceratobasidium sp. UAMH 11750]|nr:hypothetical protein FS749_013880 [Ceratobasidium sp. UAMH 11750]
MSSQSSQSSQPTGTQALSMAPAALAQLIDRLSQDHGLDTAARQQLHLFAIQSSPSVDCLWVYAALLSHTGNFGQVMQQFGVVLQRLENLTNLVRHEWQLTEAQKSSIKELQRIILVRTQTNYRDVADRTKVRLPVLASWRQQLTHFLGLYRSKSLAVCASDVHHRQCCRYCR